MQRSAENIRLTRHQLGQWAGFIGGGALLIGLIGWLWQGGITSFIVYALVVAAVGIAGWALLAPRDFMGVITGRQARYGTIAVFSTLILVGIVALTYIILARAVITLDTTSTRSFSLSNQTLDILRGVTRPIQITGFYSPRALRLREVDDQFFRLYEVATNGLVHRVYIDPDEQPAIAAAFGATEDGMVFVSYLDDENEVDFSTVSYVPRSTRQERDMTEALSRLLFSGTLTVYFEVGHGEYDPLDSSQQGLSYVHDGIQRSGLITSPIDLTMLVQQGASIPGDASAIIFARPTTDLSVEEVGLLDAYLQQGGSLLLLSDVLFNENQFLAEDGIFNRYLWEYYGIRATDAVVVDEMASAQTPLDVISAAVFADSDVGRRLDPAESPTLFRTARAIDVNFDDPPVNGGRVIASSEDSFGETNLEELAQTNTFTFDDGEDVRGPLTTAAWAWDTDTDARIVLVGDGGFVTNGQVVSPIGNGILVTDAVSWLTGFGEEVSFGYRIGVENAPLLFVNTQTLDLIAFITVILMPCIVLLIGLAVWTRRTRR
ncbi:MAG: Gldg family protein [Burkholderiales bacterium]|nr:Gldg family protein [Anaerolineae bacterium]